MDLLNVTKLTRRGEVGSDATGVSVYSVTPAFKSVMDRLLAPLFVRGNPLVWAVNSVRRKGVLQTFKIVRRMVIDMGFDLRYGTNTMLWVQMDRLNFESEHKKHAAKYQATMAVPLRKLMRQLDLPKDGVFVDFGSGKGRVLLIAAQFGFKRIVGVEFSRELCEVARANVRAFVRKTRTPARIEVVESDVANYLVEPEYNVFFMFNPFDEVVMAPLLTNLRSSVSQVPRKIWLIYNTPRHTATIDKSELFSACRKFEISGTEFLVYHN